MYSHPDAIKRPSVSVEVIPQTTIDSLIEGIKAKTHIMLNKEMCLKELPDIQFSQHTWNYILLLLYGEKISTDQPLPEHLALKIGIFLSSPIKELGLQTPLSIFKHGSDTEKRELHIWIISRYHALFGEG